MPLAHRRALLSSLLSLALLAGCAHSHTAATTQTTMKSVEKSADVAAAPAVVQARVEMMTIPTYPVGPASDFPDFSRVATLGQHPGLYPYTALHDLSFQRRDQQYRAYVLENEYLRLTVLPELGGRLFSMYDKSSRQEVVYRQESIKPGLVALRGAWISGGIEWDFPRSHSVTTFDPVSCEFVQHDDGSASIVVGDTERSFHTAWTVEMRLRPGVARMETHITWQNPTANPHDGYWWSNACFPATNQTQIIFPFYKTTGDGGGLEDWPVRDGKDMTWYNLYPNNTSTFRGAGDEDFFAAYDYGNDLALAQFSNHNLMPGRKWFAWGNSDSGQVWAKTLSDDNRPYVEIQSGDPLTQGMQFHMQPHEQREYLEYWMPVSRIGPPAKINPDCAVRLTVAKDIATVGVMAIHRIDSAKIELSSGDHVIKEWRQDLSPTNLINDTTPLQGADLNNLWLKVRDSDGKEIIAYQFNHYAKGIPLAEPSREDRPREGEPKIDPDVKSFNDALTDIWQGNYEQARQTLLPLTTKPAATYNFGHLYLYLGLAEARLGNDSDAIKHLTRASQQIMAPSSNSMDVWWRDYAAEIEIAKIQMAQGNWQDAIDRLGRRSNPTPEVNGLLAIAYRQIGDAYDAHARINDALEVDPLNALAQTELTLLDGGDLQTLPALRDEERRIELATKYIAIKQYTTAQHLLAPVKHQAQSPTAIYLRAYLMDLTGDAADAKTLQRQASKVSIRGVLPERLEELAAFQAAIAANDKDASAHYFAGLVLASRGRKDEAVAQFTRAASLNHPDSLVYYCLGSVLRDDNPTEAAKQFEHAVELSPDSIDLYLALDSAYIQSGELDKRISMLQRAFARLAGNDRLAHHLAIAFFDAGHYYETLKIYKANRFRVAEGQRDIHDYYSMALLGLATADIKAGENKRALEELDAAAEFPENLGIGKPQSGGDPAIIQYWRGIALNNLGQTDQAKEAWQAGVPKTSKNDRITIWNPLSGFNAAAAVLILRELGDLSAANDLSEKIDKTIQRVAKMEVPGSKAYTATIDGLMAADYDKEQSAGLLEQADKSNGQFAGGVRLAKTWIPMIPKVPTTQPATTEPAATEPAP